MSYLGDIAPGATLDFKFTTRQFSTGAPHTLAGTPSLAVYKNNSVTQTTTGVTLTVDFDSVTGLNHVRVVTTDAFYATGESFQVVIAAGTVDSVSVVGEVVGQFSIARDALTLLRFDVSTLTSEAADSVANYLRRRFRINATGTALIVLKEDGTDSGLSLDLTTVTPVRGISGLA